MNASIAILSVIIVLATTMPGRTATPTAFIESHCLECHDSSSAKGGLDLESLKAAPSLPAEFEIWRAVHDRVAAGEMPPKERERPPKKETDATLAWLSQSLAKADTARQNTQGRVALRRLNRTEHEYTLRDLLSLPQLEVRSMLPPDGADHGFDNVSSALDLSYVQLGRYLEAADAALDQAMQQLAPPTPSTTQRYLALDEGRFRNSIAKKREAVRVGDAVGLLRQPNIAQAPWWFGKFRPPVDGRYKLRIKTFGFLWEKGKAGPADRPHTVSLFSLLGTTKRHLATFDVPPFDAPAVSEATVYIRRGDEIQIHFGSLGDRLVSRTTPGVAVEWLEAEGPLPAPRAARRALFGDLPVAEWDESTGLLAPTRPVVVVGNGKRAKFQPDRRAIPYHIVPDCQPESVARLLLHDFMRRAFRRPVPESEVERYLDLVRPKLAQKLCFQEAMRPGFKAILCSPDFLFLREGEPGSALDSNAHAARLSYFLWRSMPDAELLHIAKTAPANLAGQIDRMLADPKAERFIEDFTGQWLDLRNLTETQPDQQLYPEFDDSIQAAMPLETRAYFCAMLERDLGVSYIVDSDFTFLNARSRRSTASREYRASIFARQNSPPTPYAAACSPSPAS